MKITMEILIPFEISAEIKEDKIKVKNYNIIFNQKDIQKQFTKFLESQHWEV